MAPSAVSFPVPEANRRTLASLLHDGLGLSHRTAKEAINTGRVRVAGKIMRNPAFRPEGGLQVDLLGTPSSRTAVLPKTLVGPGFRILLLENDFLVVDKDPGVVTIPTSEEDDETSLVARVAATLALSGHRARELFVVHRIDRWTSGLVLFARQRTAFDHLVAQFRARTPLREYLAWTEGIPSPAEGELRHTLSEEARSRRVMANTGRPGGQEARLHYWVEKSVQGPPPRARVRVQLITGRRNQIRVQFAAAGWPLSGDRFYGAREVGPGRTALHASRLEFDHPVTGDRMSITCPLPADLKTWNRKL